MSKKSEFGNDFVSNDTNDTNSNTNDSSSGKEEDSSGFGLGAILLTAGKYIFLISIKIVPIRKSCKNDSPMKAFCDS